MKHDGIGTYLGVGLSSLAVGVLVAWDPTFALTLITLIVCCRALLSRVVLSAFPWLLAILLWGYSFLGRGFAYLGVPPVFIGEAVFAVAIVCIARRGLASALRVPLALPLAMFICWGAICTAPYIPAYGVMALRDAVVWGYSFFGIAIAVVLGSHFASERLLKAYERWNPIFLLWVPVAFYLFRFRDGWIPSTNSSEVPLIGFLAGDVSVHLAGIFSFLILRLDLLSGDRNGSRRLTPRWILWGLWSVGFILVSSLNRGGMLAILAGALVVLVMHVGFVSWMRISFAVVATIVAIAAVDLDVDLGGPRKLSAAQLAANLESVVGNESAYPLSNTREWRISWWNDIVNYTLRGPHFWTGKGFGINLADSDGYQVGRPPFPLRSPHNGHMTVLARTGVPGLGLWILLQGAFVISLVSAWKRARMRKDARSMRFITWILSYWTAAMVNATFSTAMESPQAGVWFWSIFGFGIATIRQQRSASVSGLSHAFRQAAPGDRAATPVSISSHGASSGANQQPLALAPCEV